jgi:2-methylisocitrate lyase-like PEP mutase family enzyme
VGITENISLPGPFLGALWLLIPGSKAYTSGSVRLAAYLPGPIAGLGRSKIFTLPPINLAHFFNPEKMENTIMLTQTEKANLLSQYHVKGNPLILFNIWDAGGAKVLQEIGAKVIATGSWAVAAANGYSDGEKVPFELALANLTRITASVDLPVTIDLEAGYGQSPRQVGENVTRVIKAGAVGINFEDQIIGGAGLYSIEDQTARLKAVRAAAEEASIPLFINARTDIYLKTKPAEHSPARLEEALQRAEAFAKAGASGFFAPGLRDPEQIRKLCQLSTLPVNIMVMSDTPPPAELVKLGVARISYGAGPYRQMMAAFKEAGRKALSID